MKIRTFVANSIKELDQSVNEFISAHVNNIMDIKFQIESDGQSYTQYIAMVIYE